MQLILPFFIALLLAVMVHHLWQRGPRLTRRQGDWGASATTDPRVALAGMMYAIAIENAPLTTGAEERILDLLVTKVRLEPETARACLAGGRKVARRLDGDLNSRLHQLLPPIAEKCSASEKQDVIDVLNEIAGSSAARLGAVRDGLGRVAATLLNG